MRIVHMSDLHWPDGPDSTRRRIVDALLTDLRAGQGANADLFVFSGDLVQAGAPSQFTDARTNFLDPVLATLGLTPKQCVVVPGNHDITRGLVSEFSEGGFVSQLTDHDALERILTRQDMHGARERLQHYDEFVSEFYGDDAPPATSPLVAVTSGATSDDETFGVVLLDSAWRCSSDEDRGKLLVDLTGCERALDTLAARTHRIVVLHHPLDWLAPWNADALKLLVRHAGAIVLSGHEHRADPTSELSLHGRVIWSRAGCLYGGRDHPNNYCVIDVATDGQVNVAFRAWYPSRKTFDVATELAPGGIVEYAPTPKQPDVAWPLANVRRELAEQVSELTGIADHLGGTSFERVEDVLVPPRLLAIPFEEAAAAAKATTNAGTSSGPAGGIQALDTRELVTDETVVVVSGAPGTGVTASLYWLLSEHLEHAGGHYPVYAAPPEGFFNADKFQKRLTKPVVKAVGKEQASGIPMVVAVDDVSIGSDAMGRAFAQWVKTRGPDRLFLGSHADDAEQLAAYLTAAGVPFRRVYVAPFGNTQVRRLIERVTGAFSQELLDKIYAVLAAGALPRDPFLMIALTAVLNSDGDLSSLNESSILDNYVGLLLGGAEPADREGLGMDRRRREDLLQAFAAKLSQRGASGLSRIDMEQFVYRYYESMEWGNRPLPGKVIESLIQRRVLAEVFGEVRFRYSGYLELFEGKRMLEDDGFRARVVARPLEFGSAIQHAAGLSRRETELLQVCLAETRARSAELERQIGGSAETVLGGTSPWLDLPDAPSDLEIFLQGHAQLAESDEARQARNDALDDQLQAGTLLDTGEPSRPPREVSDLQSAAILLARVLKNSEFVAEAEVKAEALRTLFGAWSQLLIALGKEERNTRALHDRLAQTFGAVFDGDDEMHLDYTVDFVLALIHTMIIQANVGHSHLEGAFRRVLDDAPFMDSSPEAMFATLTYAGLQLDNWHGYVASFLDQHGSQRLVKQLVTATLVERYMRPDAPEQTRAAIEQLLASTQTSPRVDGRASPVVKASLKGSLIERLRNERRRTLQIRAGVDPSALPLPGDTVG